MRDTQPWKLKNALWMTQGKNANNRTTTVRTYQRRERYGQGWYGVVALNVNNRDLCEKHEKEQIRVYSTEHQKASCAGKENTTKMNQ